MHMESDTFLQSEETCVCVLKNIRGMLLKPPELNDAVRIDIVITVVDIHVHVYRIDAFSVIKLWEKERKVGG